MEASQGDVTVVRYLYRRGLEANPRSRFTYLSWGLFEKQQGSLENARALLKQGHQLNPRDPAILQVAQGPVSILIVQTYCRVCFVHIFAAHATLETVMSSLPSFLAVLVDVLSKSLVSFQSQ